jgi:LMBR1 domain-containing protein 1
LIGFIFALVSLLLAASWITGARQPYFTKSVHFIYQSWWPGIYDSLSHSSCGLQCGFMIEKPTKGSPVDTILIAASMVFPLDFVMLTFIVNTQPCPRFPFAHLHSRLVLQILYLLLCSFHGLVSLGVRCICIQLFAVKKRATQPQAMLLLCMYLSLLVSAMQWQIASLAPQVLLFA